MDSAQSFFWFHDAETEWPGASRVLVVGISLERLLHAHLYSG